MKRLSLLLVSLLAFLVVACGPEVKSGQVIQKWYEPESSYFVMMPISCGKSCITVIPIFIHDDEDYMVKLTSKHCREVDWKLTKEAWDQVQIGNYIGKGPNNTVIISGVPFTDPNMIAADTERTCW